MGIEYEYRRVAEAMLDELESDPIRTMNFLFHPVQMDPDVVRSLMEYPNSSLKIEEITDLLSAAPDPTRFELDKDWHALHFLLTGDRSMDPSGHSDDPLFNVVMGGHPTNISATYGPARCLSQVDVSEIVMALSEISVDDLRKRFSVEEFNTAEIYPGGAGEEEQIESVYELFPRLKSFFETALDANDLVLIFAL